MTLLPTIFAKTSAEIFEKELLNCVKPEIVTIKVNSLVDNFEGKKIAKTFPRKRIKLFTILSELENDHFKLIDDFIREIKKVEIQERKSKNRRDLTSRFTFSLDIIEFRDESR